MTAPGEGGEPSWGISILPTGHCKEQTAGSRISSLQQIKGNHSHAAPILRALVHLGMLLFPREGGEGMEFPDPAGALAVPKGRLGIGLGAAWDMGGVTLDGI